jgi:cytochrome c553
MELDLQKDPQLLGMVLEAMADAVLTVDDQAGTRYFRRITVASACLACHGPGTNGRRSSNKVIPRVEHTIFRQAISGASTHCSSLMRSEG